MTRRDPVITGPLDGLELARTVVPEIMMRCYYDKITKCRDIRIPKIDLQK